MSVTVTDFINFSGGILALLCQRELVFVLSREIRL